MSRSRRQWNNRLIIGVMAFMFLLNVPTLIKTYLLTPPPVFDHQQESITAYVLAPQRLLNSLRTTHWSLIRQGNSWYIKPLSTLTQSAVKLKQMWQSQQGTVVEGELLKRLQSQLNDPISIEAWYDDLVEPQRITAYKLPSFWLINNWQGKWLAVSALDEILLLE